jgi:signal recognition particle subunit SRP54
MARDIVIVDTAGRLHIDTDLMNELEQMQTQLPGHETLLVVDAMTGQDAVTVAEAFAARLPISGLILTKIDGDARGGAALSIKQVTGLAVKMVGTSEKLDGLEPFHPDRLAGRILGMGDVLGLIEKAEQSLDQETGTLLAEKIGQSTFTLDDYLQALRQLKKMGPLSQLWDMFPGMGGKKMQGLRDQVDERAFVRTEAILSSMTLRERRTPQIIDGSRRRRIARGSGATVQEVNRVLKQYDEMKKMTKMMKGRRPRLPFNMGPLGP